MLLLQKRLLGSGWQKAACVENKTKQKFHLHHKVLSLQGDAIALAKVERLDLFYEANSHTLLSSHKPPAKHNCFLFPSLLPHSEIKLVRVLGRSKGFSTQNTTCLILCHLMPILILKIQHRHEK